MRLRQAPAIAMLILLAWATTAYAECAWVVWWHTVGGRGVPENFNDWKRVKASATLELCRVGAKTMAGELYGILKGTGSWDVVEQDLNVPSVFARNKNGERVSNVFECWTDTMDPRK